MCFFIVFPPGGNFDIDAGDGGKSQTSPKYPQRKKNLFFIFIYIYILCVSVFYVFYIFDIFI